MSYASTRATSSGVGFFGLLTIALVVMKLMGYTTMSWWWVFAPIWAPIPVLLAMGLGAWLLLVAFNRLFTKT